MTAEVRNDLDPPRQPVSKGRTVRHVTRVTGWKRTKQVIVTQKNGDHETITTIDGDYTWADLLFLIAIVGIGLWILWQAFIVF